ncbi:MAG TPA: RNA methyltransferase [Acidimicrobiales bacterium]|nr:RNA methyltransferase [Acidimicrobiales bacterium]
MKRVRQLLRKRSLRWSDHCLVVEGAELLSVALEAGAAVESVYVAAEGRSNPAVADVVARAYQRGARVFDLDPGVIERIADTVTPQPVLAVIGFVPATIEEVAPAASMLLVCADVRDPGNAGTVIRTAEASGVDAVVCCEGTVDPTNPKTVRASAGAVFHTPIVMGGEILAVVADLHQRGFTTVGTVVRGGADYTAFDWRQRVAVVLGNEASGLSDEVAAALEARVSIPMAGQAESLNVSVSAAVLCFEALRQRRTGPGEWRSTMPEVESALTDPKNGHGVPRP